MKRPPIVILAGGKGKRLRSITGPHRPKPMVEIFGKPFLYWLIKHYINQGFTDFHISTGYKTEVIEKYPWQIPVTFHRDEYPGNISQTALSILSGRQRWAVNGDTFLQDSLPKLGPLDWCAVSYAGVDAGAQCLNGRLHFPIKTFESPFIDIGTPEGLNKFRTYLLNHYLFQTECEY